MTFNDPHTLEGAFPRLYDDAKAYLSVHCPELIEQLDVLVVTELCACDRPGCCEFDVRSLDENVEAIRSLGRPVYYELSGGCGSIGISNGVVVSFSIEYDYDDEYLSRRISELASENARGLPRS